MRITRAVWFQSWNLEGLPVRVVVSMKVGSLISTVRRVGLPLRITGPPDVILPYKGERVDGNRRELERLCLDQAHGKALTDGVEWGFFDDKNEYSPDITAKTWSPGYDWMQACC